MCTFEQGRVKLCRDSFIVLRALALSLKCTEEEAIHRSINRLYFHAIGTETKPGPTKEETSHVSRN